MSLPSWTLKSSCVWGSTGSQFYTVGSDQLLGINSYVCVGLQCYDLTFRSVLSLRKKLSVEFEALLRC